MVSVSDTNDQVSPAPKRGGSSTVHKQTRHDHQPSGLVAFLHTVDAVLDSEAKTNRAARLLQLILTAGVMAVLGTAAIVAIALGTIPLEPGWTLATVLGLTAAGGAGTAAAARIRRTTLARAHPAHPPPRPGNSAPST